MTAIVAVRSRTGELISQRSERGAASRAECSSGAGWSSECRRNGQATALRIALLAPSISPLALPGNGP
ncbi:MAG TPA: hypothetical protein DCQ98_13345 [Planctomycetaceae bacterium]|nr:hypothetical protein [Planctomycetaceae bacterium]